MSNHFGPEFTAPDDQRCEAIVPAHPSYVWKWVREEHRCPKRANQMRAGHAVCHIHGRAKAVQFEKGAGT